MGEMTRRQQAVKATMLHFQDRAFALGSVDCAKMIAFHLKQLGHKVRIGKAGKYRTVKGAEAALRRLGYETLPDAMDGHGFARIAPAAARLGDVLAFESGFRIGALGIYAGGGDMLAFHELRDLPVIMTVGPMLAAWRIPA